MSQSWLGRAIETSWLVLSELDLLWLPIIKSWRLNERMYGALTGLSKRMVAQRHGHDKFMAWRRGFRTRPPAVSSFSQYYPGNDARYEGNLQDVRYSVSGELEDWVVRVGFGIGLGSGLAAGDGV